MNRDDTRALVRNVASAWPGTPFTADAVELWHATCGHLTADQAAAALVHWTAAESRPPRPADLNAAHRALTAPPPVPRPDLAPPTLDVADELPPDEYVRAALAEARAIIGPTQYTRPENRMPRGAGSYTKRLDPKTAHERQIAWDELQRGHS